MENTVTQVPVEEAVSQEDTFGQRAVNIKFNPLGSDEVEDVKLMIAYIIDKINDKKFEGYIGNTFKGMAIRSLIQASSDAVRVLTTSEQ